VIGAIYETGSREHAREARAGIVEPCRLGTKMVVGIVGRRVYIEAPIASREIVSWV